MQKIFRNSQYFLPGALRFVTRIRAMLLLIPAITTSLESLAQDPYFRTFNSNNGLAGNEVYEALQDHKGYIWFCTNRGVSRFDGKNFVNFSTANGLGENSILGIHQGTDGKIWCRGISGTISYIENNNAQCIEARIPTYFANSLVTDNQNNVWVGSQSSGVYYKIAPPYTSQNLQTFHQANARLQIVRIEDDIVFSRSVFPKGLIIADTSEKIITSSNLTNIFSNLRVTYQHDSYFIVSDDSLISIPNDGPIRSFFIPGKPRNIYHDGNFIWAIPSEMTGAIAVHPFDGNYEYWIFRNVNISSVFKDREGAFWFCTLGSGVRYVPSLYAVKCEVLDDMIPRPNKILISLDKTYVSAANHDVLILGSDDKIIRASEEQTRKSGLLRIKSKGPLEIPTIEKSDYYIGVFSPEEVAYQNDDTFLTATPLNCLTVDAQTKTILQNFPAPSRINAHIVIGKDSLLLGCNEGIMVFCKGSYSLPAFALPLSRNRINDLAIDNENHILAATSGAGIALLSKTELNWIRTENGLISNQCESVRFHNGLIYVGTDKGLSIFRKDLNGRYAHVNSIVSFSLPNTGITDIQILNDYALLCTDEGIFKCALRTIETAKIPPLLSVNEFTVNGYAHDYSTFHEFQHDENNIVINISCLSFLMPEQNRILYKLQGASDELVSTGGGEIRYAALSPGDYEFSAVAENVSGIRSNDTILIRFHIKKPFWMTWWFITSMLVLSIALISLILFLKLQKSNQLALEKETLKTKAAKMEMRALRSQMNPHFIFNSINSIQHYILNHDKLIAQQMLSSFAKLMRNVLENSASEFIPLSKEIDTLNLYLKMESERFESKFNFNIHVDENIDMITTLVPPMIIQPMVENAILHGMVPLKGIVGKLSITLRIRGEFILCIIYDNGIGRKRSAQIKSAKGTHHQSNGIQITKERLQLCYKAIGYLPEFDMQITDHTKQDGTAEGTEVQIMLPIQKLK